jgi:nucleotide-binding universal stress UspA family protein
MRKFLVPVDGSAVANRAVAHALELARALGDTTLLLVNVQQTLERWYKHGLLNKEAIAHLQQMGQADAAQACALLDEGGISYEFKVLFGHPGELVARTAKEQGCSAIVMGTRGLGDLENVFVGSTAYKVIQLAEMPVTLVK